MTTSASDLIADAEALEHAARLADALILNSEEDRRAVAQYADHCRKSAAMLRAQIVYDHASTDAEARREEDEADTWHKEASWS